MDLNGKFGARGSELYTFTARTVAFLAHPSSLRAHVGITLYLLNWARSFSVISANLSMLIWFRLRLPNLARLRDHAADQFVSIRRVLVESAWFQSRQPQFCLMILTTRLSLCSLVFAASLHTGNGPERIESRITTRGVPMP